MEISVVLNVHSDPCLVIDTLESISAHVSQKILTIVDGASWQKFKNFSLPVPKMEGFVHGVPKSPYRNVALGIKTLTEMHPESDWYCYCEEDVLFGSDRFKHNLKMAVDRGIWMMGNDGHVDQLGMPLIQALIGQNLNNCYYLLGCCLFFHRDFISKLNEINFFDRFLNLTNGFQEGFFPFYGGYDLSEHMYPSLCRHMGGNIGVFASYTNSEWHGSYQYFPCRFRPELDPITENFPEASIMHPIKDLNNPIRVYHREKRNK